MNFYYTLSVSKGYDDTIPAKPPKQPPIKLFKSMSILNA